MQELEMHKQQVATVQGLESRMVQAFESLLRYLDGKTTKTEVVNQLTSIGTPDALKVMNAVNDMHSTLKKHKNTDLSEVTKLLRKMVAEVGSIPKELPTFEAKEAVSITNLPDFDKYYSKLEKAITGLDMKPQVNVSPTPVNVEAPVVNVEQDFATLQKPLKDVVTAVKNIVIPEQKEVDLSTLEKLQKTTNEKLEKLYDKPGPTLTTDLPFENADGRITRVVIGDDGAVPTTSPALATRLDDSADPIIYIGKAPVGSSESASVWQIAKLDTSSGLIKTWAGNAEFAYAFSDRATLTYN